MGFQVILGWIWRFLVIYWVFCGLEACFGV